MLASSQQCHYCHILPDLRSRVSVRDPFACASYEMFTPDRTARQVELCLHACMEHGYVVFIRCRPVCLVY